MAEIIASELLKAVFEKLSSEALKKIGRSQGIQSELKKLERTLTQIQSLLNDASQKEITDEAVQNWLNGLQHLAYDIDDVLDELATEAMHRELSQESGGITSKVKSLVPTWYTNLSLSQRMHHKLDDITTKLQDLEKEKVTLGLIVKDERSKRTYQTSLFDTTGIVGRQEEKKELLVKLLGDEPCDKNFSIVPIVGMGGLGKTTLARLLYDDEEVKKHFELMAWVCVSDQFDIFHISKVILQSVKGEDKEFADLNLLQVALKKQLRDKRFLVVLDDVWSENYDDWQTLVSPFHACAPGSKIIMTTRKVQLLTKLGYDHLNHVQTLSHDDAVTLFAQHALGANNFDSHPVLKQYGEGIVVKCDGLPLALSVLGTLLRTKTEEEEWKELLNSEIWRLGKGDEIVPALRLSYNDLSACLKQLFAYFSLFPKNYVFYKDQLILLWMAEGFLNPSSLNKSMERLGLEYLEELLSRSLLQHAPNDKSSFVMHDLLNDLATSVAGEFFSRLDIEMVPDVRKEALERNRHMSFVRYQYVAYLKFEPFKRAKSLRTFLSLKGNDNFEKCYLSRKILDDLLPKLPMLRVLRLNNLCISEVPETIGTLKHLRYLNLSNNPITFLPASVGNLYNLQTLLLSGCSDLIKLPNNFSQLKNLRHLDIEDTPLLNKLPLWIGQLKSLQTLTKIIVGGDNDLPLAKIKDLTDFDGSIHIKGLDKMEMAMHAQEANLLQKRFALLELEWSNVFDGSRKESLEKEVLCGLKPNSASLTLLHIVSYGGIEFPIWVGDPSFLQLTEVSVRGCKNCTSLPPLGQLPSLKKLFIEGMDEVKAMGSELVGTGLPFPSLEVLKLKNMKRLEVWSTDIGMVSFPCLQKLVVRNCPNLVQVSPEALPSLNIFKVSECESAVLRSLVQVASGVLKLKIESISGLDDVVWRGVIEYLGAVEDLIIKNCNEIRYLWESMASKALLIRLMYLEVQECQNLVRLGEKEEGDSCGSNVLTTLRKLMIEKCESMEHCRCPNNIEELYISDCPSITSVSFLTTAGGQKLKFLTINGCDKLLEKELIFGGDNTRVLVNNTSMPMLQTVDIIRWPNLTKIIELSQLIHLTRLIILACPNMESFPDHELPCLTSLTSLYIYNCPGTDASFPRGNWPPNLQYLYIGGLKKPILEWGAQNFPTSLVTLGLYCGESDSDDVSRCSQLSHLLPSSLTSLEIGGFKKLKAVSLGLQHLTSLQHLFLWRCPKMKHLPDNLLPSLLSLNIDECRKLEGRCSRRGSYWSRISHIPRIRINE
ncbi:putative P-loop containing nucleoside triphosphate hydrolase, leucine-rich repeat domain superfamily [Helianthus annuus]|uniref:P-loop containing nucleoside triphosphate hydrolase, leucine-rich repeat domain superfamily n=1 Tax=Helianthus annuus TaxID=4232 RepID=A0A251SXG9_HELAN|nr:putative disease resistance protein At3g14460 [Helianthus annuus]KAF5775466.1 putative P-loop containing nucleoside triphosphate hydrolase, leucine-rich repeat domain superfamily [Helianthus annuus]KAJ0483419.1 putative P-loop containing nucleoside triphosphate hydrolase, leucine-rich repeat domain superfamily [Helianthus annuus]KAJ0851217.1 putative P-loop containing nucleoside triphosphate hydrolase, leucine-rich repeat domain superfamily [Helianthus annuus]